MDTFFAKIILRNGFGFYVARGTPRPNHEYHMRYVLKIANEAIQLYRASNS